MESPARKTQTCSTQRKRAHWRQHEEYPLPPPTPVEVESPKYIIPTLGQPSDFRLGTNRLLLLVCGVEDKTQSLELISHVLYHRAVVASALGPTRTVKSWDGSR